MRAEADRTLATELAAAESSHRAEIERVNAAAQKTLAERSGQTRTESEAGTGVSGPSSIEPVSEGMDPDEHRDGVDMRGATDYYALWQARCSGAEAPAVPVDPVRPSRVDTRRRRWALSVAATLLFLLAYDLQSGSALGNALAAVEGASVSHATGAAGGLDRDRGGPVVPSADMDLADPSAARSVDDLRGGVSDRPPITRLAMEAACLLVIMLLLRVALFAGEGRVWHGLVITLGLVLLGVATMRVPWGG